MTCEEARNFIYDVETMRAAGTTDERATMFTLAKAHVLSCLLCTSFFEHERAFVSAVRDRFVHVSTPVPSLVVMAALAAVNEARLEEYQGRVPSTSKSIVSILKRIFHKRFWR